MLTGDIVQLIPDRTHVSFMRSYPNIIPLSAPAVARIGAMLEPFAYDVIYGAFFDRVIRARGQGRREAFRGALSQDHRGRRDGGAVTKRDCAWQRYGTGASHAFRARASPRPAAPLGHRCVPRRLPCRVAVGDGLCPDRHLYRHRRAGA